MPRRSQIYREVFFAHNGPGPYTCAYCGAELLFDDVFHVHHIDEDRSNNDPGNLTPMCSGCHSQHHSETRRGWSWTAKQRKQLGALNARRARCLECGMVTRIGPLGRHQKNTGHTGREIIEGDHLG